MFNFKKEPPIVISVGGSLIVPSGGVDTEFLTKLNKLIRTQVVKGRRFLLVAGGGKIARQYIEAGKKVIGDVKNEDLDWLGIHATRFNAHLLRTIFQDIANPRIIINYDKKISHWREPIAIGAGWKPGWSTDYDAVILARDYHANLIINLSNVDVVYDHDPNKYKEAKPIERITWEEMEKIIGKKWSPGLNAPFDPTAIGLAKRIGVTAIVASGHNFENLENIIEGEPFKGTVIAPFHIDSSFYNRDYYLGKKGGHKLNKVDSTAGIIFHNAVNFGRALAIKSLYNPKNCLEVGCSLGYLIKWLRFFGIDAWGIDFSETAKDLADPKIKKFIKVADVAKIPFQDNSFDMVFSYNFFQHLERSKIKKALEETVRVSRKYILHKIYTPENVWFNLSHKTDFSNISFFYIKYWEKVFSKVANAKLVKPLLQLPSFIETKFLLEKIRK